MDEWSAWTGPPHRLAGGDPRSAGLLYPQRGQCKGPATCGTTGWVWAVLVASTAPDSCSPPQRQVVATAQIPASARAWGVAHAQEVASATYRDVDECWEPAGRSSEARGRRLQFLRFLRGVERDRCESAPHGRGRPHSLAHARRAVVSWPAPRPRMLWSAGGPWGGRRRRGERRGQSSLRRIR